MNLLLSVLPSLLIQGLPALTGVLAAALWLVLRHAARPTAPGGPGTSRWWGGRAGLALLALPSVSGTLITVYTVLKLRSDSASTVLLPLLLPSALPFLLGSTVILICFSQRQEPLLRQVAASVLFGYGVRELTFLLLIAAALIIGLFFNRSLLF
ncbi:hypothetical protein [Deinococcus sp.]|uniref:hypothetical protein n=1 Tax=Deinococcus sp. TaxID=47478 RepID=UPI003C7CCAD6